MARFLDRCWFTAGSSGTASFADGTARTGFRNMAGAGAVNATIYTYFAESADRSQWEFGRGTYASAGGGTLSRADVDIIASTNANARVNFTNPPYVGFTSVATDVVVNPGTNQVIVLDEDNFASDSANAVPTQQSTKAYIAAVLAAGDYAAIKGGINCSANPNYPAANSGDTYRVTVAGRIGGASGPVVQVNDVIQCYVDSSSSGNHATVGANWIVIQTNIEAASDTVAGYIEIATPTESEAQSSTTLAVPPAGLAKFLKRDTENQGPLTGGANVTPKNFGTITTGTVTVDVGDRALHIYTNNGAHTLAPDTGGTGLTYVVITNAASAGIITTSAFDLVRGDPFDTTNGSIFLCAVICASSSLEILIISKLN